jgi:hypothetical protein
MINSIDDFCVWGPPEPNSVIGNTEGESVAWCTRPERGGRLIPAGALHGVQFMKTSAYIQVVGFIDQKQINIQADDGGGEVSVGISKRSLCIRLAFLNQGCHYLITCH